MKKHSRIIAVVVSLLMVFALAACLFASPAQQQPPLLESEIPEEAPKPATKPAPTEAPTEDPGDPGEPDPTEAPTKPAVQLSGDIADAVDLRNYTEKENAAPAGQWAIFLDQNYETKEYVPHYIRVAKVIRDAGEVQKAIDKYYEDEAGFYDFSLSDDQARDIEFGVLEIELYYPEDYESGNFGIIKSAPSLYAEAIDSPSFRTEGGMAYIGVGAMYNLNINSFDDRTFPGEIRTERFLFTVLKNYDENEYVFKLTWWDGALETDLVVYSYLAAG